MTTTAPAEEKKKTIVYVDDLRVIPVIVLPGVMGSTLKTKASKKGRKSKTKKSDKLWRVDDATSLLRWSMIWNGAESRKDKLHPDLVEVDNQGKTLQLLKKNTITQLLDIIKMFNIYKL